MAFVAVDPASEAVAAQPEQPRSLAHAVDRAVEEFQAGLAHACSVPYPHGAQAGIQRFGLCRGAPGWGAGPLPALATLSAQHAALAQSVRATHS